MMEKRKALLLTRVSTKYQDFKPQEDDLRTFAEKLNYEVADVISTKESGFRSIENKEGFRKVKEFFALHTDCRTLIITELSRLSRYDDVLIYCKTYFKENHIQLIVKDMGFRLFDENGFYNASTDIVFNMFASIASVEMQQKRDRFARAKVSLREEGFVIGGRSLYGYSIQEVKSKRKSLVVNESEAEQVREVFRLYAGGLSIPKLKNECVAKGFDRYFHSNTNLQKCLRDSAYIGKKTTCNKRKNYQYYELGRTDVDEYVTSSYTYEYPKIVDEDLFEQVQKILDAKNISDKASRHISILAKMLYPAECGCCLTAERKKENSAYACKRECKMDHVCGKKRYSVSLRLLDSAVWSYLVKNVEYIEQEQLKNSNSEGIKLLEKEIANLNAKIVGREADLLRESSIYRVESVVNEKEALARYESRAKEIKRDIDTLKSAVKNKGREIEDIKDLLQNHLAESAAAAIQRISGDERAMKAYIHRFLDRLIIHRSDHSYTILEVCNKRMMGKLGGIEFVSHTNDYIIIQKKKKRAFAIENMVVADSAVYDKESNTFVYRNNGEHPVYLTAGDLFALYTARHIIKNKKTVAQFQDLFAIRFVPLEYAIK